MSRAAAAALVLLLVGCLTPRAAPPPPLRVGTSGDYPPFSGLVDGRREGLDVEIAERFARDTGRCLEFVDFTWPSLGADLGAGRFDVAMGGVTMRPDRALTGAFTRPIVAAGAIVLAVRPATLHTLDRPGRRIAVNAGGHLERVARRTFVDAEILPVRNEELGPLLAAGRVDAIVTDEIEGPRLARGRAGLVTLGPLTRDRKGYLARAPELAAELDAWLREREADGTLPALRERWLGPSWSASPQGLPSDAGALVALVDLRTALMPAVAVAKERLGRPTEDAAQERRVLDAARGHACAAGVDPDRVEALFVALLRTARHVQDAVRRTPAAARGPIDELELDAVRAALARLSDQIVARAGDLVRGGARFEAGRLAGALDPTLGGAADRRAIARGISGLRRIETNQCLSNSNDSDRSGRRAP